MYALHHIKIEGKKTPLERFRKRGIKKSFLLVGYLVIADKVYENSGPLRQRRLETGKFLKKIKID